MSYARKSPVGLSNSSTPLMLGMWKYATLAEPTPWWDPIGRAYPIHSYWRFPSHVACIIEACGRVMYAGSEGSQSGGVVRRGIAVSAPASPAELAPISNPRKSPALVPTATSAQAGRVTGAAHSAISATTKTVRMGESPGVFEREQNGASCFGCDRTETRLGSVSYKGRLRANAELLG